MGASHKHWQLLGEPFVCNKVRWPMKKTVTVKAKKILVHSGPGTFYDPVEAFPNGLKDGSVVGIDKVDGNWGRMIGTNWWIPLNHTV